MTTPFKMPIATGLRKRKGKRERKVVESNKTEN